MDFQIIRDSGGELIPDLEKCPRDIHGEGQDIDASDQLVGFYN